MTADLLGISYSLVYRERWRDERFDLAVKMVKGDAPWSEEEWDDILEKIRDREEEACQVSAGSIRPIT